MRSEVFYLNYPKNLIINLLDSNRIGAFLVNIVSAIIGMSIFYHYVPNLVLGLWFLASSILFVLRVKFGDKLLDAINSNKEHKRLFVLYMSLIILSSILFSLVLFMGLLYNAPDESILIFGILVFALASGSISTLGSVFLVFFLFVTSLVAPFALVVIFHGGSTFYIYATGIVLFYLFHVSAGYKFYHTQKTTIALEHKYKLLYDKSSDGIVIIKNDMIMECNESLLDMFGYKDRFDDFIQTPLKFLSPKYQENNRLSSRLMLKMLKKAKKQKITFEWIHTNKDKQSFWVEITLQTININNEDIIHGIWRDIDDRKLAENRLKELTKSLDYRVKHEVSKNRLKDQQLIQQSRLAQMGEMISMIAHQWRQPLSAISARANSINVKLLLNEKINNSTLKEQIDKIAEYSQHLSRTIDDFRDFFKDNKIKQEVAIDDIVKSTLDIVQISLENKNIDVITQLKATHKIQTYPNEIKQVILNIIKNAEDILIQNNIQNPIIVISTLSSKDEVMLSIKDNAGGVDNDIIDKIFDPYFSTKTSQNGTGLGLYMSKTIIQEHCNGNLSVDNDKDGAVFTILIKP